MSTTRSAPASSADREGWGNAVYGLGYGALVDLRAPVFHGVDHDWIQATMDALLAAAQSGDAARFETHLKPLRAIVEGGPSFMHNRKIYDAIVQRFHPQLSAGLFDTRRSDEGGIYGIVLGALLDNPSIQANPALRDDVLGGVIYRLTWDNETTEAMGRAAVAGYLPLGSRARTALQQFVYEFPMMDHTRTSGSPSALRRVDHAWTVLLLCPDLTEREMLALAGVAGNASSMTEALIWHPRATPAVHRALAAAPDTVPITLDHLRSIAIRTQDVALAETFWQRPDAQEGNVLDADMLAVLQPEARRRLLEIRMRAWTPMQFLLWCEQAPQAVHDVMIPADVEAGFTSRSPRARAAAQQILGRLPAAPTIPCETQKRDRRATAPRTR